MPSAGARQGLVAHLAGEVEQRLDIQDGADLGLLHHAGGDGGDEYLLVNLTTPSGKHVIPTLGI